MLSQCTKICSFENCGRILYAKELCRGHYLQLRLNRPLMKIKKRLSPGTPPILLFDEVTCPVPDLEGPCHIFRGCKSKRGYGKVSVKGRSVQAHRQAWENEVGPIPEGLLMDHRCRVTSCINVKHLRVVTHQINSIENVVGSGWQINKTKTHCKSGHEFTLENTVLRSRRVGRHCKECRKISQRKNWHKHREKSNASRAVRAKAAKASSKLLLA